MLLTQQVVTYTVRHGILDFHIFNDFIVIVSSVLHRYGNLFSWLVEIPVANRGACCNSQYLVDKTLDNVTINLLYK